MGDLLLHERLKAIKERLKQHTEASDNLHIDPFHKKRTSFARPVLELIGGLAVGGYVGYLLDQWLHSLPIFFIICLFVGMIAGIVNVNRSIIRIDSKYKRGE